MALTSQGKPSRVQSFNVKADVSGETHNLYTCPANCRGEVSMLMIVNGDGNTTVSVTWYDSSAARSVLILGGKNMVSGEYVLFTGATLVLEAGDRLDVVASNNSSPYIDSLCTVTETFTPVG